MKAKIHPTYFEDLKIRCSCGNIIIAGSTKKELKTEICSACHPFYTGNQKLVDTAGRVDKFLEKVKKAKMLKEKDVKVVDEELDMMFEQNVTEKPEQVVEMAKPAKQKAAPKKAVAVKTPAAKTAKPEAAKTKAAKAPVKKAATKKSASKK